jgi:exodeoxyribonuclease VII large subunit
MLHVINRRFPNVWVQIAPVRVQGDGAAEEIAQALQVLNERHESDVIVVARGGGSLEDLQAFNSEIVARAIFSSHIPVVSAVGHETDFTIADFTADLRAPTPSSAAELIVPVKEELSRRIGKSTQELRRGIVRRLLLLRERVGQFSKQLIRLIRRGRQIADHRLRLDDVLGRIIRGLLQPLDQRKHRLDMAKEKLVLRSPQSMAKDLEILLEQYGRTITALLRMFNK